MRKKTIRRLPEQSRKIAKLRNELASINLRLTRIIPVIASIESELKAYHKAQEHYRNKPEVSSDDLDFWNSQILNKTTKQRKNASE